LLPTKWLQTNLGFRILNATLEEMRNVAGADFAKQAVTSKSLISNLIRFFCSLFPRASAPEHSHHQHPQTAQGKVLLHTTTKLPSVCENKG